MATWIIGSILTVLVFVALRYTWDKTKRGECVGCSSSSSCSNCCGCKASENIKETVKNIT